MLTIYSCSESEFRSVKIMQLGGQKYHQDRDKNVIHVESQWGYSGHRCIIQCQSVKNVKANGVLLFYTARWFIRTMVGR